MSSQDRSIKQRPATNYDCEAVRSLVFGILAEYGLSPDPAGTDSDLDDIEQNYVARGGVFDVLETSDGEIVGSVGLYPMDAETVELRKMYLSPATRGRGLGQKLLREMIEKAKDLGYLRIYLETASILDQAVHIYEKAGFIPVAGKHTSRCDQAYVLELGSR
jgi:putative acetyltransferase